MDAYIDVVNANLKEIIQQRRLRAARALAGGAEDGAPATDGAAPQFSMLNPLQGGGDATDKAKAKAGAPWEQRLDPDGDARQQGLLCAPPSEQHAARLKWLTRMQTPLLEVLRPGQWCRKACPCVKRPHAEASWVLRRDGGLGVGDTVRAIVDVARDHENVSVLRADDSGVVGRATLGVYTKAGYFDAVDFVVSEGDAPGCVSVSVVAQSTACCPASMPFSILLSIATSWFPFLDRGVNKKTINKLRDTLVKQNAAVEVHDAHEGADGTAGASGSDPERPTAVPLATRGGAAGAADAATTPARLADAAPVPSWDAAPLLCFICGVALGTVWIAMTTSILHIGKWFGPRIANEMQFAYNAPILFIVLFQNRLDKPLLRRFGWKPWYIGMTAIAFAGNAIMMFNWPNWEFHKPWNVEKQFRFNFISGAIGLFSALGYGAFMLAVASLSNACNVAFRNGFASSGVVNLLFMYMTGFYLPGAPQLPYWNFAGAIAVAGLVAALVLVTRPRVEHALWDRERLAKLYLHAKANKKVGKRFTLGQLIPEMWPYMLCVGASFCAGMIVYTHFAFVPLEDESNPMIRLALVYVNMFCDIFGQRLYDLMVRGYLPNFVNTKGRVIAFLLFRLALLPCYFLYIRFGAEWGIVDDTAFAVYVAVFEVTAGVASSSLFAVACASLPLEKRPAAMNALGLAVFLGLYPAFLSGWLLSDSWPISKDPAWNM